MYTRKDCNMPQLQYVATLPREIRKSKNVTDFDSIINKLLIYS